MLRSLITAAMLLFVSNAVAGETGLAAAVDADMSIRSIGAGTDVQDRRLVGAANVFEANGEYVWVHVAVANRGAPSNITMVWYFEDAELWRMDLAVGKSPRWRTWSKSKMAAHRVGDWRVEVLDADGQRIGETRFEVVEANGVGRQAAVNLPDEPGC